MLNNLGHLCNEITSPHLERRNLLLKLFFQGTQSYYLNTHYVNLEIQHFCNCSSSFQEADPISFHVISSKRSLIKKTIVEMIDFRQAEETQLLEISGIPCLGDGCPFALSSHHLPLCLSVSNFCLFNKDTVILEWGLL